MQDRLSSVSDNISGISPVSSGTSDKFSVAQQICAVLDDTPQSIDEIKEHMLFKFGIEISISELAGLMIRMSLQGQVRQVGSGYFVTA